MRAALGAAVLVAAAVALASCGSDDGPPEGAHESVGAGEGRLRLLAPPGYADPEWARPFERETGCAVTHREASSVAAVTRLLAGGGFDGVAARGDASRGLIDRGLVAPVNTDLIAAWDDVFEPLKGNPHDTVDGVPYGVPIGRSANFLVWKPPLVKRDSDEQLSSDLIWDPELAARYPGQVTLYDDPMSIADAALYLREHEPGLEIESPYELDRDQLDAATRLLAEQRRFVGRLWSEPRAEAHDFEREASAAGYAWQPVINAMLEAGVKIQAAIPKEGATGWSDGWMIAADAPHPDCMYLWMGYMTEPGPNAALAQRTGQAPANEAACDLTRKAAFCDVFHAAEEEQLFDEVEFWTTPLRDCGDDRGDDCTTYADWERAFAEVRRG